MDSNDQQPATSAVMDEIGALADLNPPVLRERWRALYRCEPPVRMSRELMTQALAYRVQEEAHGGLSRAAKLGGELRRMETERRRRMEAEQEKRNGTAILSDSDITRLAGELFHTELEHDDMFRLTLPRREAIEQLRKQVEHDVINDPVIASLNGKERHLAIMNKALDFMVSRDSRQFYKEGRRDQYERVRQALANDEFGGKDDALTWFLDDVIERDHLGIAKGSEQYLRLSKAMHQVIVGALQATLDRDEGDYDLKPTDHF